MIMICVQLVMNKVKRRVIIQVIMPCNVRKICFVEKIDLVDNEKCLGILTRHDFDLYYQGERYTSDQAQSFTCPFCGEMGFSLPFTSDSADNLDLFHHLQSRHADEQSTDIICPICAAMSNGEPNLVTADLLAHIANDHQLQAQQVQTPSTAGIGSNPYSRQTSSSSSTNREFDFTSSTSTRAGFRRGPLRTPSRRGGLGRGGGIVSQHFLVDSSTSNGSHDPIADLLTQLSTVRRLAAANNNNNNTNSSSSSSSNSMTLQTLTRQQYERERLRSTNRSQPASSAVESDFFDSLFSSALFIDPASSTPSSQQTWAQIVAQQQQQQQQQPPPPPPSSTSDQTTSTNKPSTTEPDPSLLRRLCTDESSCSTQSTNAIVQQQQKRKIDFVHSLLLTSFVSSFDHHQE